MLLKPADRNFEPLRFTSGRAGATLRIDTLPFFRCVRISREKTMRDFSVPILQSRTPTHGTISSHRLMRIGRLLPIGLFHPNRPIDLWQVARPAIAVCGRSTSAAKEANFIEATPGCGDNCHPAVSHCRADVPVLSTALLGEPMRGRRTLALRFRRFLQKS